jgi:aryl sulfotransferase
VGRDPRDAFLSMQSHQENMNRGILAKLQKNASDDWAPPPREPADLKERFRKLMNNSCNRDSEHSASTDVLYYVKSFWEFRHLPNILMLHYSDLKADLAGEMRRVAKFLDINVAEEHWPSLVAAATFEHMKRNADQLTPAVKENFWKDPDKFFHKGTNGQWHDVLGQQELDLYQRVMEEKLEPELANWLEHGRLAADKPSTTTGGRN